ncbi:unnamed protein product [Cylicocyclus nassatus]|uniref:Uncharacterized protein n=1 Tax=Cylicocyclus nassatus TaxID=53992 RepID=A0AA36HBP3_CYLNA|nr:unnamed protein product [Cylicocyclus nassatus]
MQHMSGDSASFSLKHKMMRHFVAFSLLLFFLKISVEATKFVPNYKLCSRFGDSACRARCLKRLNCQNGHCKGQKLEFKNGAVVFPPCVCEDCPGGQKTKKLPSIY